jgi:hypothetical protein
MGETQNCPKLHFATSATSCSVAGPPGDVPESEVVSTNQFPQRHRYAWPFSTAAIVADDLPISPLLDRSAMNLL